MLFELAAMYVDEQKFGFFDGFAFIEHIAEVAAVKIKRQKPPQTE